MSNTHSHKQPSCTRDSAKIAILGWLNARHPNALCQDELSTLPAVGHFSDQWAEDRHIEKTDDGLRLVRIESEAVRIRRMEEAVPVLMESGLNAAAREVLYALLEAHQLALDHTAQAADLGNLGTVLMRAGDPANALVLFEEAAERHHVLHDKSGVARDLANAAIAAALLDRTGEARAHFEEALGLFEQLGDRSSMEQTRRNLRRLDESDES